MNYFEMTFPNYTTLFLKADADINSVLYCISNSEGILGPLGTIHNPKAFYTLRQIDDPESRHLNMSQEVHKVLI
jgi:hypothetical protein